MSLTGYADAGHAPNAIAILPLACEWIAHTLADESA